MTKDSNHKRRGTFHQTRVLWSALWGTLLVVVGIRSALAGEPVATVPIVNGEVHCIAQSGTTTYIGGSFTRIGSYTGSAVTFNPQTGAFLPGFPRANGPVTCAIPDGQGGFYIGGSFTTVGGITRHRVAHILADNTVDPNFDPNLALTFTFRFINGFGSATYTSQSTVRALALDGNLLYIGGDFKFLNGNVERWGVAAVDAATGTASAWNPSIEYNRWYPQEFQNVDVPGPVNCLLVTSNHVYVGGGFNLVNRRTPGSTNVLIRPMITEIDKASGLATSWNPNGELDLSDPTGTVINDLLQPRVMVVSGSSLFVGGGVLSAGYNTIAGQSRLGGVAKIDLPTGLVLPWNPNLNDQGADAKVSTMVLVGSKLYIGGQQSANAGYLNLWAVNAISGAVENWNPSFGGFVNGMWLDGTSLFIAGAYNLAAVDIITGLPTGWQAGRNFDNSFVRPQSQSLFSVCKSGDKLLVGGDFQAYDSVFRYDLAAFNSNTGDILPWSPNVIKTPDDFYARPDEVNTLSAKVLTLQPMGGAVFVGGDFEIANCDTGIDYSTYFIQGTGGIRTNAAAFDAVNGALLPWNPSPNAPVFALTSLGGTIYAGGDFSTVNGAIDRNFLAAFNSGNGAATAWNPNADNLVRTLITDGTYLYAGGFFTTVNGNVTRRGIAAFNAAGNVTAFNPNIGVTAFDAVLALAIQGTTLYAGGDFHGPAAVNGNIARNFAAAVDLNTAVATAWDPDPDGRVRSLLAFGGQIYLGGDFTTLLAKTLSVPRRCFAATNPTNGLPTSLNAQNSWDYFRQGGVNALGAGGGHVMFGGAFGTFTNSPPLDYDFGGTYSPHSPGIGLVGFNPTTNQPPVINGIGGGPNPADIGATVSFSATVTDPDNDPLTYLWDFGDGSPTVTDANPSHAYAAAGDQTVQVIVSDGQGGSATQTVVVTVNSIACSYGLSAAGQSYSIAGGAGTLSVSAPAGCSWTATITNTGTGWLAVTNGSGGTGNGTISYTVSVNTNFNPRVSTITVADQTFTVTQAAAGLCTYVTQLDVYAVPSFSGCCAMIALQNSPHNEVVAVLTREPQFQHIFETALVGNKLLTVFGEQLLNQFNPQGDRWASEVYTAYRVILHSTGKANLGS